MAPAPPEISAWRVERDWPKSTRPGVSSEPAKAPLAATVRRRSRTGSSSGPATKRSWSSLAPSGPSGVKENEAAVAGASSRSTNGNCPSGPSAVSSPWVEAPRPPSSSSTQQIGAETDSVGVRIHSGALSEPSVRQKLPPAAAPVRTPEPLPVSIPPKSEMDVAVNWYRRGAARAGPVGHRDGEAVGAPADDDAAGGVVELGPEGDLAGAAVDARLVGERTGRTEEVDARRGVGGVDRHAPRSGHRSTSRRRWHPMRWRPAARPGRRPSRRRRRRRGRWCRWGWRCRSPARPWRPGRGWWPRPAWPTPRCVVATARTV